MDVTYKKWTRLGLGVSIAGLAALAGCGRADEPQAPDAAQTATAAPATTAAAAGERGEGEGGPGGESGEGGVDVALAASDPAVFRAGLAIAEAHVHAARDAYLAGEIVAAAAMFAHPVGEVIAALEPTLEARGVAPLTDLFIDASGAAADEAPADVVVAHAEAVIAALRAAALKAPPGDAAPGAVAAEVIADEIDRAVRQYVAAADSGEYEPYLDGYGFYRAAAALFEDEQAAIGAYNPSLADEIVAALGQLGKAFPTAARPAALDADIAGLAASSSRVFLAL